MRLKQSPFLHIVPVGEGYVALYNSLSLEVAFLDEGFIQKHSRGQFFEPSDTDSEQTLEQLQNLGFLIEETSDGNELYKQYQTALGKPAINILYLLLSDACNIRCRYCYFLAPMPIGYRPSLMTKEIAIKALDLFARCVRRSVEKGHKEQHIVLYGGEPTTNKKVLVEALRYIDVLKRKDELLKEIGVTLNTNGLLLDKAILEQCKISGATVAISIDGPQEIHDKMRVFASGAGTFDQVIRGYRFAKEKGVKTGVCVTVDHHNLFKMKEIVKWLSIELGAKGLGFNILIDNKCQHPMGDAVNYSEVIAEQLIESFKVARELGVYEDRIMRRVKNFLEKTPVLSDCGACGLQIVVSPDGKIGVCQAFCGSKEFFVTEQFETFEPESHPFWK